MAHNNEEEDVEERPIPNDGLLHADDDRSNNSTIADLMATTISSLMVGEGETTTNKQHEGAATTCNVCSNGTRCRHFLLEPMRLRTCCYFFVECAGYGALVGDGQHG